MKAVACILLFWSLSFASLVFTGGGWTYAALFVGSFVACVAIGFSK